MNLPPTLPPPVIVLGSVLRPVDDHRMYEKLGMALDDSGCWQVHIVGYCSPGRVRHPSIRFHALFASGRMSAGRFVAPLRFLFKLYKLRPEVVIVNSPDLQLVTIPYKILFGKKLIYDVLENHAANIMFANTHSVFVRRLLARLVRLSEHLARPFVDQYWLAERVYARELPFTAGKSRIVENKPAYPLDVRVKPRRGRHRLLFSGTLAESYGVFDAIALVKRLHAQDTRYRLKIIGYAAQEVVRESILASTRGCDFIELEGVSRWVAHARITRVIQQCDVGLLPYRVNDAIRHRIPTKCHEYAGLGLPFVISPSAFWEELITSCFPMARLFDFGNGDVHGFSKMMQTLPDIASTNIIEEPHYTNLFSNLRAGKC